MSYKDGARSATLDWTLAGSWEARVYPANLVPFEDLPIARADLTGSGLYGASWRYWLTISQTNVSGGNWSYTVTLHLSVNDGHGGTNSTSVVIASGTQSIAVEYVDVSGSLAGTAQITAPTNKMWDVVIGSLTGSLPDNPGHTTLDHFEKTRVGSTASCTVTVDGHSCTVSTTITTGNRQRVDYWAALDALYHAEDTGAGSASAIPRFNSASPNFRDPHSHTSHGGVATSWSVEASAASLETVETDLVGTVWLDRVFDLAGVLRRMEDAWASGDSLNYYVTGMGSGYAGGVAELTSTGAFGASCTQKRYSVTSTMTRTGGSSPGSHTKTDAINEQASVRIYLKSAGTNSLTSLGDDPAATRVMLRAWRWPGATIEQAASYSSGFGSGNSRTYSPHQGMSGYAYLDVVVTSTTGNDETRTLRITDAWGTVKEWSVMAPASGTPTTRRIDLCAPTNLSYASDSWDNPYPRLNPTDATHASEERQDGPMTGITKASAIALVGAAGVTLGALTLVPSGYQRHTFLPSLGWQAERQTKATVATSEDGDTITTYYTRRFWQQDTDGRLEEESDFHWQVTLGPTGVPVWAYSPLSISSLCGQIAASDGSIVRHPGWSATALTPVPGSGCSGTDPDLRDCYLNSDRLAVYLHGGGAKATGASPGGTAWSYGFDMDGTPASADIEAQLLFDELLAWIPDQGDVWSVGDLATTGPIQMRCASIQRAQAVGGCLDDTFARASGKVVQVDGASSSPTDRGTGTTGGDGTYQSGVPYAQAVLAVVIRPTDPGAASVSTIAYTRKRIRAWFALSDVDPFRPLAYDSERGWLHIGAGPKIKTYHAPAGLVIDAFASADHPVESFAGLSYDTRAGGLLWALGVTSGGAYKIYRSWNGGVDIEEVLSMSVGSGQIVVESERGALVWIYDDGSSSTPGTIKRRVSWDRGATWDAAASVTVSGSTLTGRVLSLSHDPRAGAVLAMAAEYGGSTKVLLSWDVGATWEVKLTA